MAIIEADAQPQTPFEQDVAATQRYWTVLASRGSSDSIRPGRSQSSAGRSRPTTPWRARRRRPFTRACASCSPRRRASPRSAPIRRARPWS